MPLKFQTTEPPFAFTMRVIPYALLAPRSANATGAWPRSSGLASLAFLVCIMASSFVQAQEGSLVVHAGDDIGPRLQRMEQKLDSLLRMTPRTAQVDGPAAMDLKEERKRSDAIVERMRGDSIRVANDLSKTRSQLLRVREDSSRVALEVLQARTRVRTAEEALKREQEDAGRAREEAQRALEAEIMAVLGLGRETPDALLESLKKRSVMLNPENVSDLDDYRSAIGKVKGAYAMLTMEPGKAATITADQLNTEQYGARFPKLDADRTDVVRLLRRYCQNTMDLDKRMHDSAEAPEPKTFLEDLMYLTIGYPYLREELTKAIKDPKHRMKTPQCN
jgi:hypothetical protein